MPEILFKNGSIAPEEHNILKKHVEVSINLIQYHIFFANRPLAKNVIENHHERLDGKGYPKGSKNFHYFSKILGMLDVFDSMTTDRPWRKKFARSKVLEWLYENSKQKTTEDGTMLEPMFERELVLCFERILMLYEIGEKIDIYHVKSPDPVFKCRIVEQNPGRPDRPIVELLECIADPHKIVAGKTLNMLSSKDLYLGETADFKKEPIY
jgi:HD-GYP domain-containing protein (c-di-GMP phosphodiesterase class II)